MIRFFSLIIAAFLGFATAHAEPRILNVGYAKFAADITKDLVISELNRPITNDSFVKTVVTPVPMGGMFKAKNPLNVVPKDFNVGNFLPYTPSERTAPPATSDSELVWFKEIVNSQKAPDVFVIGGHQVISEGWHDDAETKFMFLPTLLKSFSENPDTRAYFENVKLVVLGGCNAMTNLEPHKESTEFDYISASIRVKKIGDYLSPEEIKLIYFSGISGKNFVTGKGEHDNRYNSLEFYRNRLATEYGVNSPKYEYTRDPRKEICNNPPYGDCEVTNLDRILPDSGLFDGSHRYNYPWIMKNLFKNAYLIVGYTSASPSDGTRARILAAVLNDVRRELKVKDSSNILYAVIDSKTSSTARENLINLIRKYWTLETYKLNRQRPSGSITPALPQLDSSGIFTINAVPNAPLYRPYRNTNSTDDSTPVFLGLN